VPSGSMANQVAIRSATESGDELIIEESTHSYNYEGGGPAALSGCSVRILHGERGIFTAAQAEAAIRPDNAHFPHSRMIIAENTNNRGGGSIWPVENIAGLGEVARRRGLHLHMDGARLMNACVARGLRPTDYTQHVDSVSMCFSKGLGAPVGSIVAASAETIKKARKKRKQFGGGMRQAGILAAAAIYALDHHIDRLAEDHQNARVLAQAIESVDGLDLLYKVETNIIIFRVNEQFDTVGGFLSRLARHNILAVPFGPAWVRMVTHLDVSAADVAVVADVLRSLGPGR